MFEVFMVYIIVFIMGVPSAMTVFLLFLTDDSLVECYIGSVKILHVMALVVVIILLTLCLCSYIIGGTL
jgi:hypothetical protein